MDEIICNVQRIAPTAGKIIALKHYLVNIMGTNESIRDGIFQLDLLWTIIQSIVDFKPHVLKHRHLTNHRAFFRSGALKLLDVSGLVKGFRLTGGVTEGF